MEIVSSKIFWLSFFLLYVRLFAALILIPFLSGKTLPVIATGVVCTISAFFLYLTYPQLVMIPAAIGPVSYISLLLKDILYGIITGFTVMIIFSVFTISGNLASHAIFEKEDGLTHSSYSYIYYSIAVLIFLVLEGHHAIFKAFVIQLKMFPSGEYFIYPAVLMEMPEKIITIVSLSFATGVMISAPILISKLVAEMVTGLSASLLNRGRHISIAFEPFKIVFLQVVIVGTLWKSLSIGADFIFNSINTL